MLLPLIDRVELAALLGESAGDAGDRVDRHLDHRLNAVT